jgi:hypothetical protein
MQGCREQGWRVPEDVAFIAANSHRNIGPSDIAMQYIHTQTAPLHLLIIGVGIAMLLGGWLTPIMVVQIILFCSGGLMFLLAFSFRQLTVSDQGNQLLISFGPLPLFRRRIVYSDIETVERGRTSMLDGWGIHLSPSGGWTWNLWGFDCVDIRYRKGIKTKKIRIGTDDPIGLEAFLKQRIGHSSQGSRPG